MTWQSLRVSAKGTHHLTGDAPAYTERFDEVLAFHAPGLAPVSLNGQAWHIYPDGRAAYGPRYRRTFGFYEGLAAAINDDGWHHIQPNGMAAYAARYAWCGNYQDGRCTVREANGRYYHITPDGIPAYSARWRYAGDFRDGIGVVQAEAGRSTHIDTTGKFVHEGWFLDLDVYHKGFARARDEAGWMHIDRTGQPVYGRRFASVEPFYNGQARVERHDGGLEVIDETGSCMTQLRPALRSEFAALSADLVGFWKTQTIATAVELGLFDALPGSASTLAQVCDLRPDRTLRILRALGELNLVEKDDTQWRLTVRGEYLRKAHPWTLADAAREFGNYFPEMWKAMPEAMRQEGGWSAPDIFGDLVEDEARCKAHHRMLKSYALHDYSKIPEALALAGNERVVDVGGGLGVLASSLVEHYPDLNVLLLDRPEVIEQAMLEGLLPERLECCPGDLFEPWEIDVDVVVLARVLHDWNDADALRILHRAREVLSPGGRLFIVEMVTLQDAFAGSLCDLHLLMSTGGQERTALEYKSLMERSGFVFSEIRQLAALPSIVLGIAQ